MGAAIIDDLICCFTTFLLKKIALASRYLGFSKVLWTIENLKWD